MSLLSLLIALAAERYLSSSAWQFNVYYQRYLRLFKKFATFGSPTRSLAANIALIVLPVVLCYFLLSLVSDGLIHFVLSTLVLIGCFGCVKTRDTYKQYLMAAFRGEQTTASLYYKQLIQDKNLPDGGFGATLVWLNYRYFIAIMIFFVLFGAPGALFYRLLSKLNESPACQYENDEQLMKASTHDEVADANDEEEFDDKAIEVEQGVEQEVYTHTTCTEADQKIIEFNRKALFVLDWLPVRIVSFGYMLVGHFSRAMPVWLDFIFEVNKSPYEMLTTVAHKSEDFMVEQGDCTAEPCLLVRLAKRTLLLCLAAISLFIITGVIS